MGELGELLRQTREAKGLSLRQVEEATKIRTCYLEALESEDLQSIPGLFYAQGFLRTYARLLGIDADNWIQNLRITGRETGAPSLQSERLKLPTKPKTKNKMVPVIVACVTLSLLVILISLTQNDPGSKQAAAPTNTQNTIDLPEKEDADQQTPSGVQNQTGNEVIPAPIPAVDGVEVKIAIIAGLSWISVHVDGKKVFEGTIHAGEEKTFSGDEKVIIRYGNPGVVKVIQNGQDLGLAGDKGRPVTSEYDRSS
ncbi:MAG: helix-turn-helix domain-containing protein [Bacillota bacterium]